MNLLIVFTVIIGVSSAAVITDLKLSYDKDSRYFLFPGDGDGLLYLVDSLEPVEEQYLNSFARNNDNYDYWLYTRSNPVQPQKLIFNSEQSIKDSNIDFEKTTVFLVHGWRGYGENEMNQMLTEAFLQDDDVNVIVLCWNTLASRVYTTARLGVPDVGKALGNFINWLTTLGLSYEKTHLVGFSLGGHLVGNAGRATGSQVKRITALDPAGPMWYYDESRITESDGQYVEVIHTNTRLFGFYEPCGHADFYPNGGNAMPGCWLSTCSHGRAYEYMAATIKYRHLIGNQCDTLTDADNNRCNGELYEMGNSDLNKNRAGIYRMNTRTSYPF